MAGRPNLRTVGLKSELKRQNLSSLDKFAIFQICRKVTVISYQPQLWLLCCSLSCAFVKNLCTLIIDSTQPQSCWLILLCKTVYLSKLLPVVFVHWKLCKIVLVLDCWCLHWLAVLHSESQPAQIWRNIVFAQPRFNTELRWSTVVIYCQLCRRGHHCVLQPIDNQMKE